MISSASTLLLATLVFNAASVFGAPIRYPNADIVVRADITKPVVPKVRIASSREVPEVRDTVPPPVEKREASTEDSNLPRRFPRQVYHDFYQKRADLVEPPVARAPKPDSERRFPRRVYHDLHAERADTPVARAEKPESERRYPRRALFEKRNDAAAPAVPTAVANSTDTTTVIKNFIDSTKNQTLQPGTTIKETTVLMNKVTYVSDKNPPAPANNQCNSAPVAGTSSIPSGTPTAAATSASATGTIVPTTSAAGPATSASATGTTVPTSSAEAATSASASATGAPVPTSSAGPATATPSSATSSTDAQPTSTPGAASPSAPASAADPSATTTTAADPAATSAVTNSRRSVKEVSNEPVAREPEPEVKPSGEKPAPQRQSGPLVPREPAPVVQRTSGPLESREPLERSSGPLEPREPAPTEQQRTRGPLLPRRLGFSGAALASLARRSNHH